MAPSTDPRSGPVRALRASLALLPLVAALLAPTAWGSHDTQVRHGHITLGHPTTFVFGVTERRDPCNPDSELNGIDGWWYSVAGFQDHPFALTMSPTLDADVFFYTADCDIMNNNQGGLNFLGAAEGGFVPTAAGFIIVAGWLGSGNFTLYLG